MNTIKAGYLTSEFYIALLTPILALLGVLGLHVANADALIQAAALIASTVASAIASHGYSQSRAAVKAAAQTVVTTPAPLPAV